VIAADDRGAAAAALEEARRTVTPIEPLTESWPGFDVEDAYAVQAIQIERRRGQGTSVVGWKVGLTSAAMQRQLGVSEPDFGPLLDDMEIEPEGDLACDGLISPRVEAELAFRLGADVGGPGITRTAVAAAVDAVLPALEIIDSRIVDWRIKLADTIADHASCAAFVVGPPVPLPAVDIEAVGVSVSVGDVVEQGVGSAVLGNPLEALAWLANTLAPYGESLCAGQTILAGALHASIPFGPGDRVEAVFDHPALGSLSLQCQIGTEEK
jgi:2-keto-4-pentenoate hydratase